MSKETTPIQEELNKLVPAELLSKAIESSMEGSDFQKSKNENYVNGYLAGHAAALTSKEQPALYEGEPVFSDDLLLELHDILFDNVEGTRYGYASGHWGGAEAVLKHLQQKGLLKDNAPALPAHPKVEQPAPVKVDGDSEGWISVDDALPEDETPVLVVVQGHFIGPFVHRTLHSYHNGRWIEDSSPRITERITHWQELPSPPQTK